MTLLSYAQAVYFFGPAYVADVSPVLAARLLPQLDAPIDGGRTLRRRRLLGSHKTWRGLAACVVGGVAGWESQRLVYQLGLVRDLAVVDYAAQPIVPGLLMGAGAALGDALKSFLKRQVGIPPGAPWLGFDQLDFFVGAVAFASLVWLPPPGTLLAVAPLVFVCDLAATALFWRLGLKQTWP
jgi:CDP-2,3-bis-(O-geranylgeranyl)-sn-glycerol synthase